MKLILVRHGRTLENEKGVLQGHLPGELSEEGKKQVHKLADRLKSEHIDVIYSSDLKRAADTARIIASHHPKLKVHTLKGYREFDFGSISNMNKKDVDWNNLPKDIETPASVGKRAKKVLDSLYDKHKGKTVLLVGHGGINKVLMGIIEGKQIGSPRDIVSQLNTAVNIFEITEDKQHRVHLLNCTRHLE